MAIRLEQVKAAVALLAKQNKEALAELGTKIADLNKQIADLIEANANPSITDAAFEADLQSLLTDAKELADIVPGSPTPPAPPTT